MLIPALMALLFTLSCSFIVLSPERGAIKKTLSPFGIFVVFFSFVFFLVPALQTYLQIGRFNHLVNDDNEYFLYSSLLALSYILSVSFSYIIFGRRVVNFKNLSFASLNFDNRSNWLLRICFSFFVIGSFFIITLLASYIGNFALFMFDRINILSGYGYVLKLFGYSLPLMILLFLKSKRMLSPLFVFVFLFSFIVFVLLGSRTNAVIIIPYIILCYILMKPDERMKPRVFIKLAALFFILISIVSLLAVVREAIKQDGISAINASNITKKESFSEGVVTELYRNYGHNELLALAIERRNKYDLALGHTFFAGLVSFVPRTFWPGKPVGGGPMMANIVSPGAYSLGSKSGNSSLTTGLPLESYLNFGVAGLFIIGFIHGFFISKVTLFTHRVKNSVDFIVYLFLFHYLGIVFITGEFLGVFSGLMILILPIYFFNKMRI